MDRFHFRNLVFEGGGVKGIAYVGALEELRNLGIMEGIKRVGGTSAGAINAVLVGLGYSQEETSEILWELDFNSFLDDSWGFVRDTQRLLDKFGWYPGDFFRQWIGKIIAAKTGNSESTFADIAAMKEDRGFADIYLIGTNLSTGFSEVFSAEHTPRICLADAVRISMSIPLFFSAVRNHRGDVYVDGGLLRNYPIKLFDREKYIETGAGRKTDYYEEINREIEKRPRPISRYVYNQETLGFRLDSRQEIAMFRDQAEPPRRRIEDFFDFVKAMMETVIEAESTTHLHQDDWERTIFIDTLGVNTTDFDLSDQRKRDLVESGRKGVRDYFKWFQKAEDAANRPVSP